MAAVGSWWEQLLRRWYAYRERQLDAWEREVQREEIRLNMAELELDEEERELEYLEGRTYGGW